MSCETCKDKPDPGTEYEKTKCAKCRLASGMDNPSNHGKTHIDIDALVQNEGDREYAVYEQVQDETINEVVLKLVRGLARMDPVTRNIVCWRIANPSGALQVVAKKQGLTVQAASVRLRNACKLWPLLRSAINYKSRYRDGKGRFTSGHNFGFKKGWKGGPGRPRKVKK